VAVARLILAPLEALQASRGMLFPWIAVLVGCGIGAWFTVAVEPGAGSYSLAALALAGGLALAAKVELARPLGLAVAALAAGWIAAGIRAHSLDAPMLNFRYYGPTHCG